MNIRDAAPSSLKPAVRRAARVLAQPTAPLRMLPDFIVAGASRCGTTSLHQALITHPGVFPPVFQKGVHYFDVGYTQPLSWYRGHFPVRAIAAARSSSVPGAPQAFESAGYYMHHPMGAARMAESLPGVKIVVMLRDPVERAYSAYKHEFARGFETVDNFEEALAREGDRLAGEVERLCAEPGYISHAHRHQSYTDRGQYAGQVSRLFDVFGRERVHVLFSEDFFATPEPVYEELLAFLGLPIVHAPAYEQHNARRGTSMNQDTHDRLTKHFEPFDTDLASVLGRTPAWRRG